MCGDGGGDDSNSNKQQYKNFCDTSVVSFTVPNCFIISVVMECLIYTKKCILTCLSFMYVCVCVCMYYVCVCMYVCIQYVCMYLRVCLYVCNVYVCMYVCMYVCTCILLYQNPKWCNCTNLHLAAGFPVQCLVTVCCADK